MWESENVMEIFECGNGVEDWECDGYLCADRLWLGRYHGKSSFAPYSPPAPLTGCSSGTNSISEPSVFHQSFFSKFEKTVFWKIIFDQLFEQHDLKNSAEWTLPSFFSNGTNRGVDDKNRIVKKLSVRWQHRWEASSLAVSILVYKVIPK